MKIIAITGGVATGKSTVAKILAALLKTDIIDADEVVHGFLAPGTKIYKKIIESFGKSVLKEDNCIDRKALGRTVFGDISQKEKLERIIHPAVKKEIKKRLKKFRDEGSKWVIIDIPLLFEAKMEHIADTVIVVLRSRDLQIRALRKTKGISLEEANNRIDSQLSLRQKAKRADFVVDNNGTIRNAKKQVEKIFLSLQNM